MRTIIVCALLLLAMGCKEVPLPDSGMETSTDPRGELVIRAWEQDLGHALTNSCKMHGLQLVCDW